MSLSKKFRAYTVTFTLLFSILSFSVFNINYVRAQPFDEDIDLINLIDTFLEYIDFNDPLNPHPFRYVGVWDCNKTTTIKGEITFNLYFTSPLRTRVDFLNFRDSLNISIYYKNINGSIEILKNGNKSYVELQPNLKGKLVQSTEVSLKNINQTINDGESIIFTVEVIQSEKPLKEKVEKNVYLFEGLVNWLKTNENPEYVEWGIMIDDLLNKSKEFAQILGISEELLGEKIGELFNVLFSSAFFYGSDSYPSSISFKTTEDDNKKLYFREDPSEFQYGFYSFIASTIGTEFPYEKNINETKPDDSSNHSWPPIAAIGEAVNLLFSNETELENNTTNSDINDVILWAVVWILKTLKEREIISENVLTYYLHNDNIMNEIKSTDIKTIRTTLSNEPVIFKGDSFVRNIIIENATAELYLYYPRFLPLRSVEINVTLKNGEIIIASDTKEIQGSGLNEILGPNSPTVFYFEKFKENQIWYDKDIILEISVSNKPAPSFLNPVIINYNSINYPSSLILRYRETDNVQIGEVIDKTVYAGGSAEYLINVTSRYMEDEINITVEEEEIVGNWTIDYYPKSVNIGENGSVTINLFVNSTAKDDSAYNSDKINLLINASGKTGFSRKSTNVSVSFEAVEYNIEIIAPDGLKIQHGTEGIYQFIVRNRNKGFIADNYIIEVTSEHDLSLSYNTYIGTKSKPLDVYNENDIQPAEAVLNVTVFVPWYTDLSSDVLTFNISSQHSLDYLNDYYNKTNVTTKIVKPNILESVYKLFESAAQKIGLRGWYAGWTLIGTILLLLLIIVIFFLIIKRRKFVELICLDRIKEIKPDEKAEFEITVKNLFKNVLTYELKTIINSSMEGFDVSLDTTQAIIESKQSTKIKLIVKPTDYVKKDDWIEVKVVAKALNKKKPGEISTVTTIKDSETKLHISSVFHWPRVFKKDDRVETSFKLLNIGNVSARNISVILYVNGEEKNKVEDITIPCGGYADISIPWIAVKGKNEVYIVVK